MRDETLAVVLDAIRTAADDKGYLSARVDDLVAATELSRSAVKLALMELAGAGAIDIVTKSGPGGGYRIRLVDRDRIVTESKPNRDRIPEHAMPLPSSTGHGVAQSSKTPRGENVTESKPNSTGPAHRPVRPHEMPASGASLIYRNESDSGQWRKIDDRFWVAPNGDTVSVRSMTPSLRARLGIDR